MNALALDPADGQLLAAAGYQHIRMFDVNSNNASPVVNYEGTISNKSIKLLSLELLKVFKV